MKEKEGKNRKPQLPACFSWQGDADSTTDTEIWQTSLPRHFRACTPFPSSLQPRHATAVRSTQEGSQVGSNHHGTLSTLQLGDIVSPWTNSELWEPCDCSKPKQTRNKAAVCPKSTSEHSTVLLHAKQGLQISSHL